MAEQVYLVEDRGVAAEAILALFELARRSTADFSFGPSNLDLAEKVGIYIDGDIEEAIEVLNSIEGLVRN